MAAASTINALVRVLGLDLSLTATGVAYANGDTEVLTPPDRTRKRGDCRTYEDDMARLDWLADKLNDIAGMAPWDLVVIEGYSRGSKARREEAGELGGLARLLCWRWKRPVVLVPPKLLKVFATNKGDADKARMAVAASRSGWVGDGHDAADAWWLRQMGLYAMCHQAAPIGELHDIQHTAYRDEAVAKVEWPKLGTAVAS